MMFLIITFTFTFMLMLMGSGIFDPLTESVKYAVTNLMIYIPTEKWEPYPDRVKGNYFTMYIVFNVVAVAVVVFIGEKIVWLVRNT